MKTLHLPIRCPSPNSWILVIPLFARQCLAYENFIFMRPENPGHVVIWDFLPKLKLGFCYYDVMQKIMSNLADYPAFVFQNDFGNFSICWLCTLWG